MNDYVRELDKSQIIQTNKELVKQFYDSFENKNQDSRNFCKNMVEWITSEGLPSGNRYLGLESVFGEHFPRYPIKL